MKDSNIHIMIIWSDGLVIKDKIISDLKSDFEILNIFNFSWEESNFQPNLKKFYAHSQKHLDEKSFEALIENKIKHCGNGSFLAIVFEDYNPKMEERNTSSGKNLVNANVFDKKLAFRNLLKGGHQIHASDNNFESNKDISLLFGCELKNFKCKYPKTGILLTLTRNVLGVPFWNSLEEFFFVLNNTIDYVILRNFENIPDTYQVEGHGDIDLLVEDLNYIKYLTGGKNIYPDVPNRVYHEIEFVNRKIPFDFRFIGDNYYDQKWELDILKNKELDGRGFYKPNATDHFYSLLYHAYVQKPKVAKDYKSKLKEFSNIINVDYNEQNDKKVLELLNNFMRYNNYNYYLPQDLTVYYNKIFLKLLKLDIIDNSKRLISSSVNRTYDNAYVTEVFEFDNYFLKSATNPISKNEFDFLSILKDYIYFPVCNSYIDKEGHGEVSILRVTGKSFKDINENRPFWSKSNVIEFTIDCLEILIILSKNNISHRDIRPENIIVHKKNNKYYPVLIDFGWSAFIDDENAITPIGLGSFSRWKGEGFSDAFSMGSVLKVYFGRFNFVCDYIEKLNKVTPESYSNIELFIEGVEKIKSDLIKESKKVLLKERFYIFMKKYRVLKIMKNIFGKKVYRFFK